MRKSVLISTTVATALAAPVPAFADDAAPPAPVVDARPVETGSGSGSTQPDPPPPAPAPTLEEQLSIVTKAFAEYRAATDANAKKLLLFAVIAAVSNLLITILKKATDMNQATKRWLPVVALGMGVVVGLFTSLAAGQSLALSVLYGAGPPLGVFVHELLNFFRKKSPAPAPT